MMTTSQSDLADQELRNLDRQAEKGTYLSKRSHMSGWIDLYAPDAPAAEWGTKPWKLVIEKDAEKRTKVSYKIKPEHAYEAFNHNGLVAYSPQWQVPVVSTDRLKPTDEDADSVKQEATPKR